MFVSRLLSAITVAVAALGVVAALPEAGLAQDVIKIGAPLPLTGPLSPEGLKQKRGYDLWADAANAKGIKAGGKTYKVEIVYADYASNTPRAVQTAERMITEDKVQFLFAPFGSGATKATSAISEKYQIPMLAPSASSQEIFDQHFKYIFSTLTGNETVSVPIAKLVAAKNKNIKRVAVLARNDLFPLAVAQEFEKAVKAEGMEVVVAERYAIGAMDHSAAITKMRSANPDWVYASGYINDLILIRRQMNDLGLKAPVITEIAGPAYDEFAKTMGPLAENITSMSWWHPAVRYKGRTSLVPPKLSTRRSPKSTTAPKPTTSKRARQPAARSCRWRSRRPVRSIRSRCATRFPQLTPRRSMAASGSTRMGRSTRSSRRSSNSLAESPSSSGPMPSKRAKSALCRNDPGRSGFFGMSVA